MAGKVPKQISILAEDSVAVLPELQALADKGHVVHSFHGPEIYADLDVYDLILGKQCCSYVEGMEKYLVDMIKGARARKYGNKVLQEELFNE